jgi:hypothetical protein
VIIGLLLTAPTARAGARLRSGVSVLGQFGVGGNAPTIGPALAVDLGSVLSPEWAVAARLSVGGILTFNMVRLGLGAEYSLGERWTLGVGVAGAAFFSFFLDLPSALSVVAPVRVDYALGEVGLERHGWTLSFEVLPGVAVRRDCGLAVIAGCQPTPLTLAGLIGIGYAWR